MKPRTTLSTIAALALAVSLAACGDDGDGDADTAAADGGAIAIEMGDMYFEPDAITVPAGEVVEVELDNVGASEHDLVLDDGTDTGTVPPGESTTVEIGPFEESTTGWRAVPGHQSSGMELDINVE